MNFDGTVFVVDDDAVSMLSLEALLRANKFPVQTFNCAADFLDAYDGKQKGCLVADLRMPGIGGLELQREMAARNWQLPIVMISGHADRLSQFEAVELGAADFLEKPFAGSDLCEAIRRAMGN